MLQLEFTLILGWQEAIVKTLTNENQTVRDARADYFRRAGFPPDGGDAQRWVVLRIGSLPIFAFPNSAARRRSVKLHDIHHVLTGYDTSWTGESEIAAWEIGSGCRRHWVAWVLNLAGMAMGFVIAPKRMWRAFVRGRSSGNLYGSATLDESLLDRTVGELRAEIGIAPC
jgi:hypothetical protein